MPKYVTTHQRVTLKTETVTYHIEAEDWSEAQTISDNMSIDDEPNEATVVNRSEDSQEGNYSQSEAVLLK